jgi:hypothetical protein
MVVWQEAISPKYHSDKASKPRQTTAGAMTSSTGDCTLSERQISTPQSDEVERVRFSVPFLVFLAALLNPGLDAVIPMYHP